VGDVIRAGERVFAETIDASAEAVAARWFSDAADVG
jgi:hypothetical protein